MRREEQEEWLEKIRNSANDMAAPQRLEPEQMMKELKEQEPNKEEKNKQGKMANKARKRNKPWYRPVRYGAAAAVIALTLITAGQFRDAGIGVETKRAEEVLKEEPVGTDKEKGEGILTGGETSGGTETLTEPEPLQEPEEAKAYTAQSYEEIYQLLKPLQLTSKEAEGAVMWKNETSAFAGAGADISEKKFQMAADVTASPEFSDTNLQVEGVDEGDIVKTDGTYVYILSKDSGTVQMVEAVRGNMKKLGKVQDTSTAAISKEIQEFYVYGDRLSVIRQAYLPYQIIRENKGIDLPYQYEDENGEISYQIAPGSRAPIGYDCIGTGKSVTYLETYDISDRNQPVLLGTVSQDGTYKSSRRTGDYIYLFTSHYVGSMGAVAEWNTYIPKVNDKILPYESIYIPDFVKSSDYLVVTAVDVKKPEEPAAQKAVMADGNCFYVSQDNIYIGATRYDGKANQYDYTELIKLSYKNGSIVFRAHGNVDGYLNNQFSMDEYQGNLRLVTTLSHAGGKSTNSLVVLDKNLKKLGEIEDLAPGEQVYSARFMGAAAYFVTFRNMDPLFSADLSDPSHPKILGELKITGFSEYLHSYEDGLLLGIGREIDPDTGNFKGLKLSMFDISNPKEVEEVQKKVEESFEYSAAWDDHKAVLISPSKNLMGFAVQSYDKAKRIWKDQYVVYSYDKRNGFEQQMAFDLEEGYHGMTTRGFYIDSWFYVVERDRITSFRLEDFRIEGQLKY